MSIPTNPSGITITVYRNSVIVKWVANPETDIKGYNIYNSTTSGGGISGYVKLNESLIDEYSEVRDDVLSATTQTTEVANVRTTTTVENITTVYVYSYTHSNLTEEVKQYYVITAVNNLGEESANSIEVAATPLIITTEVLNPTLRTQNDVSLDYIATLLDRQPKLDVKPGSETRQIHVDPNSLEFAYAYVRMDFLYKSQSILTLRAMDDANNDRISDPVADSSYKQLLKTAFFFDTDDQVQAMIDYAFDKIGSNYGKFRLGATQSTGEVTFWTSVIPTKDLNVPLNSVVSTAPTESSVAITFTTLTEGTIEVLNLLNYYNPITEQYELTLPVQAAVAGSSGNVSTSTIIVSTISGLNVTNNEPSFGGRDLESNADFSDRIQLAFVGLDVGTINGYKRVVTEIPNVTDVRIVEAGNQYMQRDYDDVREKHVYGKVDVYIKGATETQYVENFGFLYNQIRDGVLIVTDENDMIVKTNDSNVTASKPIYNITEIRNVTRVGNYDLTGDWIIKRNAVEMPKISDVEVELATGIITFKVPLTLGDAITADYIYKVQVTNEIIINPALGGETNFALDYFPLLKYNYAIYKNDVALIENTNYVVTLANGALHLLFVFTVSGMVTQPVIGDTYTNNSSTFSIDYVSATTIKAHRTVGTNNPLPSGTLTRVGIGVPATIAFSAFTSNALTAGDKLTATYIYKKGVGSYALPLPLPSEVVIASATGTETTANLANANLVESYVIHSDGVSIDLDEVNAINANIGIGETFTISSGTPVVGDTYSNNGSIFIVEQFLAPDLTTHKVSGTNDALTPSPTQTLTKVSGTGSLTLTYTAVTKDIINSTFRYRDSEPYVLLKQPAQSIISIVGAISGTLTPDINYKFNKIDDILLEGNSTKASRYLQFYYSSGMPSGEIATQEETPVLVNNEFRELLHNGIDTASIVIRQGSIVYTLNADYWVREEANGVNVSIARSVISTIPNGTPVTVEYNYGELLTITYTALPLLNDAQNRIESVQNATADVLVKGVLETKIDYEIAVILKKGTDEIQAAVNIKDAIFAEHAKLKLGIGIAQSDVIRVIEEVTNVVSVIVPLTKMAKANGTQINREIITSEWVTYQSSVVASFTTGPNALLQKTLGGNAGDGFYAVFEDDRPLVLVTNANDVDSVKGQAYISSEGEVIVSLLETSYDSPDNHTITVCYVVNGETGARDMVISDLEYIVPGEILVTTTVL